MSPTVLFFQSTTFKSWREKLAGVYRYASQTGWQVQVIDSTIGPTEIRKLLRLWQPLGCIVDRAMSLGRTPTSLFGDTPVAYLDQNPRTAVPGRPTVTNDSTAIAHLAAGELLGSDARHFTYIPWSERAFWSDERERAFAAAIRKANRTYLPWTGSLVDLPRPCGIFCANDIVAQRAMAEANRLGIAIPDDFLLVGVDNDELICEHTHPTLTSILPDFEQAGYRVAESLDQSIQGKRPANFLYGPLSVIRRESSRTLRTSDPRVRKAQAFIRRNYLDPGLQTEDVVAEMNCSRRLADLRFREATGHSIREEIHALRLERAYALLRNPRQAISPIPSLCGYASEPFFKRMFKRETGLTMREWRKRNASG